MITSIDAIIATEKANRLNIITDIVRSLGQAHGFDRFILFSASPSYEHPVKRIYWIEGNWFDDGSKVTAARYMQICPVTRHLLDESDPFFWTKQHTVRGERYRIVRHPRGSDIHGLQIPIFGPTGLEGALSLGGKNIDSSPEARILLSQVGMAAFRAARKLIDGQPVPTLPPGLSPREREILQWVTAGKRQAEIAATLGLSERTIENHLRNARHRLGVATTAQAVRFALASGEIGPVMSSNPELLTT
ncbi:PA1136 family autoinducer-binding transcriptional regulator [Cupriavidus pauculus]|uniref:LuxR family transcriptional regulator n=1 Tax=Cupriavidus pauculus TaxID=82633 RepID=A0A2N5C8I1_9BURK|nr:PA1136 family autoinducer-binding transcriptional regulator [Cupriavidus pauculus]PLP98525.1 LuxR family transcriptional regulator [Cupriavidus pauculus]